MLHLILVNPKRFKRPSCVGFRIQRSATDSIDQMNFLQKSRFGLSYQKLEALDLDDS